jgi:hypothetical protein
MVNKFIDVCPHGDLLDHEDTPDKNETASPPLLIIKLTF